MGIPILGALLGPVKDLISEVVVDKDKKKELEYKLEELADRADSRLHEQLMGQIEVNKQEAAHPSVFVAGWRPYVGWGAGTALLYSTLFAPFLELVARWFGWTGEMPVLDTAFLQTILLAMLGVGAMRSYDKMKGTDTKGMQKRN